MLLMCSCILGIYLFQGYWLYNSYRMRMDQFNHEVNDALRSAVFKKQFVDIRNNVSSLHDSVTADKHQRVRLSASDFNRYKDLRHSLGMIRKPILDDNMDTSSVLLSTDSLSRVYADTMARQISELLILNRLYSDSINLIRLDSILRTELRNRDIFAPYRLDTYHISLKGYDRLNPAFRDSIRRSAPAKTFKTPLTPLSSTFVQASFEETFGYVMHKMLWAIVSSLVLVILTTAGFVYMLQTILKQKKLSEVKNDFINNMTHELKTPIATVSAAVEAMQNFNALNDTRKTQNYLSISKQELSRLSDLVEKVLQIAAEEKEEIELFKEPTALGELIETMLNNYEMVSSKEVKFTFDNQVGDRRVMVDRTHLANAVSNLVDNAIKYSGDTVNIRLNARIDKGFLELRVIDNGIGIPRNYQENVFDKFFRVPTGNLHKVKGFGLGLSYVKKVVDMHGGTILLQSEIGKGSEFIIRIPVN